MRALQMARVSYSPARAYAIGAQIGLWSQSLASLPELGPGLHDSDAVQLGVHLTVLRGICKAGTANPTQIAWFGPDGTLRGVRPWGSGIRSPHGEPADWTWLPIYGEEAQRKPDYGSGQLGPAWSRDLSLGLGTLLHRLAGAQQGPQVLPEWIVPGGESNPAMVQLVVAGPVLRLMKNPAPWRYLDSEFIRGTAYVGAAASAFETRLRAEEGSGIEIPPTPLELAAADQVRQWARPTYNRESLIGGATVAGTAVGITLLAAIRSRAEA
jgi:hypothetical protein